MIAWLILGPFVLYSLVIVAAELERRVVEPQLRAQTINRILETRSADDVERDVSRLLRDIDRPPRLTG